MKSPHCSGVAGHSPTYSSSSPRLSLTFAALTTLSRADCQFGWLQGLRKLLKEKKLWLLRPDLNQRPRYRDRESACLAGRRSTAFRVWLLTRCPYESAATSFPRS